MNDDIINRYTLMLIKQYWEKKKARSEIQAMLRHWQIIADFIRNPDNFDLDRVTGYRLDVIGRIVGLHRSVPAVIARVFFGFDGHLNTAGFDSKSTASFRRHMVTINWLTMSIAGSFGSKLRETPQVQR